ncbi:hypothetical protein BGZ73_008695 [Actinomortierella ambigua]|nr:hypothetical protein BGZ73_008695 [Actinomortierella ambigua]
MSSHIDMKSQDDIENEVRLLKRLHYRYIIQFYDVVRQHGKVLLVTDFAEFGSLKQVIDKDRLLTGADKERISREISKGLSYIHDLGVLHRDLKSANVLLTKHMEVRLCDFGLADSKVPSDGWLRNFSVAPRSIQPNPTSMHWGW